MIEAGIAGLAIGLFAGAWLASSAIHACLRNGAYRWCEAKSKFVPAGKSEASSCSIEWELPTDSIRISIIEQRLEALEGIANTSKVRVSSLSPAEFDRCGGGAGGTDGDQAGAKVP